MDSTLYTYTVRSVCTICAIRAIPFVQLMQFLHQLWNQQAMSCTLFALCTHGVLALCTLAVEIGMLEALDSANAWWSLNTSTQCSCTLQIACCTQHTAAHWIMHNAALDTMQFILLKVHNAHYTQLNWGGKISQLHSLGEHVCTAQLCWWVNSCATVQSLHFTRQKIISQTDICAGQFSKFSLFKA